MVTLVITQTHWEKGMHIEEGVMTPGEPPSPNQLRPCVLSPMSPDCGAWGGDVHQNDVGKVYAPCSAAAAVVRTKAGGATRTPRGWRQGRRCVFQGRCRLAVSTDHIHVDCVQPPHLTVASAVYNLVDIITVRRVGREAEPAIEHGNPGPPVGAHGQNYCVRCSPARRTARENNRALARGQEARAAGQYL